MIITEQITINGKGFVRTYSDQGKKIERAGVRYDEAIDPVGTNRKYVETSEPIETGDL